MLGIRNVFANGVKLNLSFEVIKKIKILLPTKEEKCSFISEEVLTSSVHLGIKGFKYGSRRAKVIDQLN